MTPEEFVKQVYYAQEKVVLDFWPCDDKYKEVLYEANLVLQELQNAEDWTWLRERLILGDAHHHRNEIPEFELPDWVYKVSTLNHDTLKLHRIGRHGDPVIWDYIEVPITSAGSNGWRSLKQFDRRSRVGMPDGQLKAVVVGRTVTFNRPLLPHESHRRVAVLDVQRRLQPLHICSDECPLEDASDPRTCKLIEPSILDEIPDPNYVVMQTAARHAAGSPPAQYRIQDLQDAAQKILSAMRQNDASTTDPEYIEWEKPGYLSIV